MIALLLREPNDLSTSYALLLERMRSSGAQALYQTLRGCRYVIEGHQEAVLARSDDATESPARVAAGNPIAMASRTTLGVPSLMARWMNMSASA